MRMLFTNRRQIVTFYSYKGGVGRTMALANVAWRLANKHGLRVLAVDWDLEAPGLHDFWGLTQEELANARGVLDFLLEWRNAVRKKAPAPPNVRSSIIPITRRPHAPRFGSLSLLIAGQLDSGFDARLAAFDWQEFYEKDRGAVAIETLRKQITEDFDIVLVDSRTGLTDTGGICTIQLPDGVVLLTAPNEQSFRGIEKIARGIVAAPSTQRGGRDTPHLWLVPSRISVVEEVSLAEEWYRKYEAEFERGMKEGLWKKENHLSGLRSHEIPFRARWSFGEQLLHDASGVSDKEILARAYDQLAETLRHWQLGQDMPAGLQVSTPGTSIPILETRVQEAERRGDIRGMGEALLALGQELRKQEEHDKALAVLERAAGIFLGREDRESYADAIYEMGLVGSDQLHWADAKKLFEQALAIYEAIGARGKQILPLGNLALIEAVQRNSARAEELRQQMLTIAKSTDIPPLVGVALVLSSASLITEGQPDESRQNIENALASLGGVLNSHERKKLFDIYHKLGGTADLANSTKQAEENQADQAPAANAARGNRKSPAAASKKRARK
ncbi:MAG: hypothetical protein IPM54_42365 [Polyangiaceae bacterium]|nr:hypothetical protein [Polyangiaceae bacterium]